MTRACPRLSVALLLALAIDLRLLATDTVLDVHVEIIDFSGAGPNLALAIREAQKIYASAGIRLVFSTTRTPQASSPDVIRVLVLSDETAKRMRMSDRMPVAVLGHALIGIRRAYIFYDRIAKATSHADFAVVLGRVIAHELGHILLEEPGHSVRGLMQADLRMTAPHTPQLLAEQSKVIRERLLSARQ